MLWAPRQDRKFLLAACKIYFSYLNEMNFLSGQKRWSAKSGKPHAQTDTTMHGFILALPYHGNHCIVRSKMTAFLLRYISSPFFHVQETVSASRGPTLTCHKLQSPSHNGTSTCCSIHSDRGPMDVIQQGSVGSNEAITSLHNH